ncbi:hypothetical protein PRUPE_8G218600 [Prunus persica]|uniref:Exocyst component Exo84 C-terminal domain-containing protein n=2 Tax=Prunus persica TaxID=3760 RepID=M5VYF7_PRUPE|nr:exocyst complex component EXO84B [Prunus persica]ONH93194.1 hypothetical protein PRUPE_8G218600 [Prunus persica]
MESSSSRFRFRDLPEMENCTQSDSDSASDLSSVSSDRDDESDLQSMTGKGIKHLCSELLELKAASSEEFHKHIFSNYSAFVRIFEEVGHVESELMQLKNHVVTQKRLVSDLVDGIYFKVLSKETIDLVIEESGCEELLPISKLEAHANDVLETLDTLLSENRIDEALSLIELEDENLQRLRFEEDCLVDELRLFSSAVSERKAMLILQLTMVAENPRIAAPELQKALVGLCRLGDSHLATQLLIKYYHSRIASGIHNFQASKSFLHKVYIRELSKFVFSMISQAARSFVMLYGETSPYALELIQWARQETKVFGACFDKYVKTISEISGGLSTAVEAVQFAMSFCSLLETQRLVLRPYLIKRIRPCMEEVLDKHLDHFKKVIDIFTATDAWVLGRYLVSGIMNEGCSSMVVGQQPEYCLLTNSGRKFVTLLQSITVDVTPLFSLQIEGSIVSGLMNLFKKYIDILERAINCEIAVAETNNSRLYLANSVQQQVSILANLSALEQLFSSMVRSIFKGVSDVNSELMKIHPVEVQVKELDSCISFIQEASCRLRALFCEQFILKIMSVKTSYKLTPASSVDGPGESSMFHGVMPSLAFQVLFLELRKLEKLSEDNIFEVDWLLELLRELIEAVFVWVSNNKENWDIDGENMTVELPLNFKQFVLDVQFLVEISKYGGYFSNNPLFLLNLMKSALLSTELDPRRDVNDDIWAIDFAAETIQKLLESEKTLLPLDQEPVSEQESEDQSKYAADSFPDDASSSEEDAVATDEPEVASNAESESLNAKSCVNQSKNSAGSLEENVRSSLEDYVEPEEDAVATHDPKVAYNAKTASVDAGPCMDRSKISADSFQEDVRNSLEDYVEPEVDAAATYDPEVAYNAKSASLNAEPCMDQSKNAADSFREDVRNSLEDAVATYDPELALNAEPCNGESKYATDSFEDDVVSPSDDYTQSKEDVKAVDNAEVALNEETASLITESCPQGGSCGVLELDWNSSDRGAIDLTDTSIESQTTGSENLSNKAVDISHIIEETNVPST